MLVHLGAWTEVPEDEADQRELNIQLAHKLYRFAPEQIVHSHKAEVEIIRELVKDGLKYRSIGVKE